MPYIATMNVPGYLPWSVDDPVFDSAVDAWSYLATERREQEDAMYGDGESTDFSDIVMLLDNMVSGDTKEGTVYGWTPGYSGISTGLHYDLGIAYSVTEVEE